MKNYLSQHGFNNLVGERDHLTKVERPQVCAVVAWAASLGDRSENADYQYGKKRLREIDKRVRFLNKRLSNYEIVDIENQEPSVIKFGARVKVITQDDQEKTFTILGPDELNLKLGRISYMSPIGKSLMGKAVGDCAEATTPNGLLELEIISIKYINIEE